MKKLLSLLMITLLFSCGEKPNSTSVSAEGFEFSYEIDTVKVNSGDLLLAVDRGLSHMALSPDKNSLYFYNSTEKRLDEIDLNNYEIVRSIQFTQEGPKGIGSLSVYEFHITEKGEIFTSSFDAIRKMDSSGELMTRLNWDEMDFVAEQIPPMTIASFAGDFNDEGNLFFGTYGKSRGGNSSGEGLIVINWEEEKATLKEVPLLAALEEYEIVLEGEIQTVSSDRFYLQEFNNQVLISTNGVNGISIYDYKSDSLIEKTYSSDMLPERRAGNFPRKVNSMEVLQDAVKAKALEHQFGPFVYDEKSKRFYRISYYRSVSPLDGEKWNFILSIFDQNLNLLHDIADFPSFTGNVFFRDGRLYKGINLDDELYFIRLKIKPTK
ncbi:DUF4221 family protein [Algoriphagus formosus]|uniref:DUF4221 domain-containing protein n=1 Tax=Algoriphagus formosus TaxID=2007308 RepID=A0A4R5UY43_9BACT|nr:DUF4221 family protein [Algoriphagus aquimaris]TDK44065.1 DUF4221 domain-containing protein [Algoriphagus aquimaris]